MTGSCCVAQAGLELLGSNNLPTLTTQRDYRHELLHLAAITNLIDLWGHDPIMSQGASVIMLKMGVACVSIWGSVTKHKGTRACRGTPQAACGSNPGLPPLCLLLQDRPQAHSSANPCRVHCRTSNPQLGFLGDVGAAGAGQGAHIGGCTCSHIGRASSFSFFFLSFFFFFFFF